MRFPDKYAGSHKALSGCNGAAFLKLVLHDLNINGIFFTDTHVMLGKQLLFSELVSIPNGLGFSPGTLRLFGIVYSKLFLQNSGIIWG